MMDLGKFEEHLRQTSAARTAQAYLSDVRQFLSFLSDRPVTLSAVEEWIGVLNHGARTPQTLSRKRAAARRLLGFLAANGDRNAFEALTILKFYKVTPPVREADRQHVRAISRERYLALCDKADTRYRALFAVLWWTGARISEVLGDEVSGIPPLTVANGKELVECGCVETRGKGGRRRVLILPSAGRDALRGFVESQIGDPGRPLFQVSAQAVNSMLHHLGFGGGAHSFRHSYRARLRLAGVSEELQRALMGHGSRDVTTSYGAVTVEEMLAAVERLA